MDEQARRAEREAAREGDASARVRLAHAQRRSGRWADVLAATAGLEQAEALAVRAEALLRTEQVEAAAVAAAAARAIDPGAVGGDLAEEVAATLLERARAGDPLARLVALGHAAALGAAGALEPASDDRSALVRAQAARLPALAPALRDDPSALVRSVARRVAEGEGEVARRAVATRGEDEEPRTRLFSAHGPDFDFGPFVALQASGEARFACCDLDLFREVHAALGGAARRLGFSRVGYGLAVPAGVAFDPDALEADVARLNDAGALPFPVRMVGQQPYDPLGDLDRVAVDDGLLCACYVHDLTWHPVRHFGAAPDAPLFARIAAALRPGHPPDPAALEPLLQEARGRYTPLGARALALFVEEEGHGKRAARRARSAEKAPRRLGDGRG
ncbi:MAG: hypothetical protein M9894_23825 [Planctomycetes bacterium]|nr:hypothetical protein [Planctomycetota bacterium]